MEDELGPLGHHHLVKVPALANIANDRVTLDLAKALFDLLVDRVEREFAVIQKSEPRRRVGSDLPRELSSNRTAGTGHEHATSGDQGTHARTIEHGLGPAQKVLDSDRLDAVNVVFARRVEIG